MAVRGLPGGFLISISSALFRVGGDSLICTKWLMSNPSNSIRRVRFLYDECTAGMPILLITSFLLAEVFTASTIARSGYMGLDTQLWCAGSGVVHSPCVVGMAGFEPTTSRSRSVRAANLRHIPSIQGQAEAANRGLPLAG